MNKGAFCQLRSVAVSPAVVWLAGIAEAPLSCVHAILIDGCIISSECKCADGCIGGVAIHDSILTLLSG